MEKITVTKASMPPYKEFIKAIEPLWQSKWLTNMGMYYKNLEEKLKEYLDVSYVSLMVNGHMALEMILQAMEFPENGEVITTPFTFISTTHAITRNHLIPVFCDIKSDDYTMDESKIESLITKNTVAIVPVHVYGNVCNIEKIREIADRHGLKVIYDACHAFGESYKGKSVAKFGDASIYSFHATKVYNTVEGGAVTFSNADLYKKLYNLKNFGIQSEEDIVGIGANAKMNELCAIMGLCNLPYANDNIKKRQTVAMRYLEQLPGNRIQLPIYKSEILYNYGYFPVLFENSDIRNLVYSQLKQKEIYTRKYFYPLTIDAECYREMHFKGEVENARNISDRILVLPIYPELTEAEQDYIIEELGQIIRE